MGGGGNPIKHVVCLELENRSFDHMLGFLKQINPDIDGLDGTESNPLNPSDPNSPVVHVTDNADYVTIVDPGHSVHSTTTQLWGDGNVHGDIPAMDGFNVDAGDSADQGAAIMECFSSQTVPAISTLATSFALVDRWHASIPGPTQPNRMFVFSATSDGAANNNDAHIAIGYPQRSIFDSLYDAGHSFGVYYSDFPGALILRHLREPKYWPYIKQIHQFYNDCQSGVLPSFSFLEPRWFTVGDIGASDQHPPHNVALGEYIIANVYEAIRNSPLWEKTLLIVTYDEHGGFFDHVPTPILHVPNPDGKVSRDPPFAFERLGVRVPAILVTPWVASGTVFNEPTEEQSSGEEGCRWEHSSIASSMKHLFNLPDFLTRRDTWAAHFETAVVTESAPRTDCPLELPLPGSTDEKAKRKIELTNPVTDEYIRKCEEQGNISTDPLTDLQYEILTVAKGLTADDMDVYSLKTEHQGAVYVRTQLQKFFGRKDV